MPEKPPDSITDEDHLEDLLSEPSPALVDMMRRLNGDIVILGVAGKMGITLARMAKRASDAAGTPRRVIGVARFSLPGSREKLEQHGVETVACDLLDQAALNALPEAPHVVYMAGMKFGSSNQEALTWAMNCYLPGMVAQRYRHSRVVAFSTGNVYGMVPVASHGSREEDPLRPDGDYAMSCLGRERILDHFSRTLSIPMAIIRLNYAVEMRYGVLADLARKVWRGDAVDLRMGYFNAMWQTGSSKTVAGLHFQAAKLVATEDYGHAVYRALLDRPSPTPAESLIKIATKMTRSLSVHALEVYRQDVPDLTFGTLAGEFDSDKGMSTDSRDQSSDESSDNDESSDEHGKAQSPKKRARSPASDDE